MAKKVLLLVFGAVAALIGMGLGIGGAALLALPGDDGFLSTGNETLYTPTRALVSESVADYSDTEAGGLAATVRIKASSQAGGPVFLGVGRSAEVDRYLAGVAHDEVRDVRFSPFQYEAARRDGERSPAPPADQPGWIARAVGGGEQALEFDLRDQDDYRLVVMNADGTAGVDVRASFGLRVPVLRRLGIGLAVAGVLSLLVGLLMVVWGVRTKVPPRAPAWGPYGQPGYGQPGYGQPGYGYPPPPHGPGYGPPPGYPPPPAPGASGLGYGPPPGYGYPPGQTGPPPGWEPPAPDRPAAAGTEGPAAGGAAEGGGPAAAAAADPADTHPADTHPADTHPADTHPADTYPADTHPAADSPDWTDGTAPGSGSDPADGPQR